MEKFKLISKKDAPAEIIGYKDGKIIIDISAFGLNTEPYRDQDIRKRLEGLLGKYGPFSELSSTSYYGAMREVHNHGFRLGAVYILEKILYDYFVPEDEWPDDLRESKIRMAELNKDPNKAFVPNMDD